MSQAAYVAVDWGTSSFRLWLVDRTGNVLGERRSHEGMMAAGKLGFPTVLQSHLDAVGAAPGLPVVVCGMAGARGGWVEAGYVDTPARLASIPEHAVAVPGQDRDIRILPGIAQRDPKAPDVMRGEETQLLGVLGVDAADDVVVCMPGTHSKWVRASGGDRRALRHVHDGRAVRRGVARDDPVPRGGRRRSSGRYRRLQVGGHCRVRDALVRRQSAVPGAIGSAPLRRQASLGPRENIGHPDRSRIGGGARRRSTRAPASR